MSRKCFLVNLVGPLFMSSKKAFGTGNIEVWLKIYGATTYGQTVTVFDNRGSAIISSSVVGSSKKLGEKRAADLAGGSVVIFCPFEGDEAQLVPCNPWSRADISTNLHSIHTLTIRVDDGVLSVEYN